jgi:hypothetical protein
MDYTEGIFIIELVGKYILLKQTYSNMKWILWLGLPKTFRTKKELIKYCSDNGITVFKFGRVNNK